MDWITGIQRAINYVEAHITDSIDYEEVAKQAYSSSFHFQRVFSILCGFSLGDYIRMRRLTLAAKELASSNLRVIDVALKYGYDTPESFSRAFSKFHGTSPTTARLRSTSLKSFSPLSIKLSFEGGNILDYRIETIEPFQLICKKLSISDSLNISTEEYIKQFWNECIMDGTIASLNTHMQKQGIFKDCIVGASFGKDATDMRYPYAIGAHYDGKPITDRCLTIVEIPAHTYLAFTCVGNMPAAFVELYKHIYSEFLPASEYQPCGGCDFEVYPSADISNPHYSCEFWIAVKKKKCQDV